MDPNWFTFACSDANGCSVDMAPPRGGAPGQVVLHGADEWVLQVVGQSVTDMMEQAVTHLSTDEYRYDYNERDGGYRASVFFNMVWRAELPDIPEVITGFMAGLQSDEKARELREHAMNLVIVYSSSETIPTPFDIAMPVDEAVAPYHEYKFEIGEWTQDELSRMQKFEEDVKALPVNAEDGFISMMSSSQSTLTVCTSSFDEETYKSTETCHDLDISGL